MGTGVPGRTGRRQLPAARTALRTSGTVAVHRVLPSGAVPRCSARSTSVWLPAVSHPVRAPPATRSGPQPPAGPDVDPRRPAGRGEWIAAGGLVPRRGRARPPWTLQRIGSRPRPRCTLLAETRSLTNRAPPRSGAGVPRWVGGRAAWGRLLPDVNRFAAGRLYSESMIGSQGSGR